MYWLHSVSVEVTWQRLSGERPPKEGSKTKKIYVKVVDLDIGAKSSNFSILLRK